MAPSTVFIAGLRAALLHLVLDLDSGLGRVFHLIVLDCLTFVERLGHWFASFHACQFGGAIGGLAWSYGRVLVAERLALDISHLNEELFVFLLKSVNNIICIQWEISDSSHFRTD